MVGPRAPGGRRVGAIVQKLDIDGNGEISLDELMAWFDEYPDADVTDLFSLLRSVVDSNSAAS